MAQFDVYINSNSHTNVDFPYLLDIQNSFHSNLSTRIVVPLCKNQTIIKRLTPTFIINGEKVVMSTMDIASVSIDSFGKKVFNLESNRSEIIDAIDFLINGF